ncbi:MAG: addiction module protein [Acidimicrobiales bacterium]
MTVDAEAVLREALALPTDSRADIAAGLLASLDDAQDDDPGVVGDEWAQELQSRARRVLAGEAGTKDWHDVRRQVADQFDA